MTRVAWMTKEFCQCESPVVETLFPVVGDGGGRYALQRCRDCDLVWDHPMPGEAELASAYSQEYYSSTEAKFNPLIEAWTRYSGRRRAYSLLRQHGSAEGVRVLDVGCGRGVLLQGFREAGADVLGIERQGAGFDEIDGIENLSLDDLLAAGRTFDIIVVWHVLEHLPDPVGSLRKCRRLLAQGGSLFVEVPNFASFQSRLFGSNWFHLDLPRHLFHFTPRSLRNRLDAEGFKIVLLKTFSLDQNLFGFLQSALNVLPVLSTNHFYGLLRGKLSVGTMVGLMLYSPLVIILTVPALLELIVSTILGQGAVLSIRAVPTEQNRE